MRDRAATVLAAIVLALGFTQSARASTMAADVALWREDPQYQTVLDLVNWTAAPANAEITFFDAGGQPLGTKHFSLDAESARTVTVASLGIKSGSPGAGLLTMMAMGSVPMPVIAMARIMSTNRSQSFQHLVEAHKAGERRSGMGWRPSALSQYNLVLSNTTASEALAEIHVSGRSVTQVQLKPHETVTEDVSSWIQVGQAVAIEVRSAAGTVAAAGLISDATTGFSSSVQFAPAGKDQQTDLHASYVPIGVQPNDSGIADSLSFKSMVLLHNPTNAEARVDITLQSTVAGGQDARAARTRRLAPGATTTVVLPDFWHGGSGPIGMTIASDHAINAKAVATDQSGDLVFEIPVVDPAKVTSSFANPWRLTDDESSVLALTNPSADSNTVSIHIRYAGGDFNIGRTLEPGETTLVNIRQLRDEHVADIHGFLLPDDVKDGFIAWSSLRGRGRLIGRTIVYNLRNRVSTTYSCGTCNCPPSFGFMSLSRGDILDGVVNGPPSLLTVTAWYDDGFFEDVTRWAYFDGYDRRAAGVDLGLAFFRWPGWDQLRVTYFSSQYMCYWDDFMCDDGSRGDCNGEWIENSTPVTAQAYLTTHASECYDDRDEMIREYLDYPTYDATGGFRPNCWDFIQYPWSPHFSFADWNTSNYVNGNSGSGRYSSAIIRDSVQSGLEGIRNAYGNPLTMTSGYRSPANQGRISGQDWAGRHVLGDAADVYTPTDPDNAMYNTLRTLQGAACVEPRNISKDHFHVDYRPISTCSPIWRKQDVTCSVSVSPGSTSVGDAGGPGSLDVTTSDQTCSWSVASNDSWISIASATTGLGNATVSFATTDNSTSAPRSGSISIGATTVVVTQAGESCNYDVAPTSHTFTAGSGAGSVSVAAPAGCSWSVSSSVAWVSPGATSGTGSASVSFSVSANGAGSARSGVLTVAGRSVSITQNAAACTYSLSPTVNGVTSSASTGTVAVTAPTGCSWTTSSSAPWLRLTTASGSGNGSAGYTFDANPTSVARSGTVTIAGQTLQVNQAGVGCSYTVSPQTKDVVSGSSELAVSVSAPAGCSWSSSSSTSWLSFSGGSSGAGAGFVAIAVAANTTTSNRSASVTVAGAPVTITQSGLTCSYSLTPTSASAPAGGGSATVSVTAATGCSWTAVSPASWLTMTSGASGTGNGTVSYTTAANTSPSARTAALSIGGKTVTITEAGTSCVYGLSPTSTAVGSGSSTGVVTLTTGGTCSWNATSNDSWIAIAGSKSGTGNAAISFSVVGNQGSYTRVGTLSVSGQTYSITQPAAGPAELPQLDDPFSTSPIAPSSWSVAVMSGTQDPSIQVAASNGQLSIGPLLQNTAGSHYNGVLSVRSYDLTGNYVSVRIAAPPAASTGGQAMLTVLSDANNHYRAYVQGGTLYFEKKLKTVKTQIGSVAFDPVAHALWRVRFNDATDQVLFETAPVTGGIPGVWTTRATVLREMSITSARVELKAGTSQAEAQSAGTVGFDDAKVARFSGTGQARETELLTDGFATSALNSAKWQVAVLSGSQDLSVQISQANGRLAIGPLPLGASGNHYNGVLSTQAVNLTGGYASIQLVQGPSVATAGDFMFTLPVDASNHYRMYLEAGLIKLEKKISGVKTLIGTSIQYDAVNHGFWRIRHDATLNKIVFETAPNAGGAAGPWAVQGSIARELSVVALKIELKAGTFQSEGAAPGTVVVDNARAAVPVARPPVPSTPVVDESFGAASLDTSLWSTTVISGSQDQSVRVSQSNGGLNIGPLAIGSVGSHFNGVTTATPYSLDGSYASVQLVTAPASVTNAQAMLTTSVDKSNHYRIYLQAGLLRFEKKILGTKTVLSSMAFDPTEHAFWRIRHAANTDEIAFETATNAGGRPSGWTTRETAKRELTVTALKIELKAGTSQSETAYPGTVVFDNLAVAHLELAPAAPTETILLSEMFTGTVMSGGKWSVSVLSGSQDPSLAVSQSNALTIGPLFQSVAGSHYNGVLSVGIYDLTGAYASVQMKSAPAPSGTGDAMVTLPIDGSNHYRMYVEAGALHFEKKVATVKTAIGPVVPYDPATHAFWRVRHDPSADQIAFETAADVGGGPGLWSTRATATRDLNITGIRLELKAGTFQSETSAPGSVTFDNVRMAKP